MKKKKILYVGESSYLSTGYATLGREFISRLNATGRFEVAELGCYGEMNDRRNALVPWKFYHNMPRNEQERQVYQGNHQNQFGEWKFEEVALDFQPDIVFDARDQWMMTFEQRSPFRQFYHWAVQPTCDSEPQHEEWLATFMDADAVFAYSDYGLETLREQSNGRLKLNGVTPPAPDAEAFFPIKDRASLRKQMGLPVDALIIGTVMRNQARKLFPDLIAAFARFLLEAPEDIARRSYLYLHTAWPDVGWDIPALLKEHGVGHRTFFTYRCKRCQNFFPSLFQDTRGTCKACGATFAMTPNSIDGLPNKALGLIYNLFSVYVQYAIAEGFGVPLVEAASCGIPVMAVDYSAMSDVVRKLRGYPLPVQRYYRETMTGCYRALPDQKSLVAHLLDFLSQPETLRLREGVQAREAVLTHYTWEQTAQKWIDHFDSVELKASAASWHSPPRIHHPVLQVPPGLSNEQFVRWGFHAVAGRPELATSYTAARMIRDLNQEQTGDTGLGGLYINEASTIGAKMNFRPFGREQAMEELLKICQVKNYWERRRAALLGR